MVVCTCLGVGEGGGVLNGGVYLYGGGGVLNGE